MNQHGARSYEPMTCRACKAVVHPALADLGPTGRARRVSTRLHSLYQCDCGVSYSNALLEASRVLIHQRPELNVPAQVLVGLRDVLDGAINETNRRSKSEKFCFETSEDAVTWTVCRYLESVCRLDAIVESSPADQPKRPIPALLLWGVPVSGAVAKDVAQTLRAISDGLQEATKRRSEPDVILVWSDLSVLVEVKYRSPNEQGASSPHFPRYLDRPDLFSVPVQDVEKAGFYELVRNWRIGVELAERRGTAFHLVNLGPRSMARSASAFSRLLAQTPERQFSHRSWADVLTAVSPAPAWFEEYSRKRHLDRA